jgi:hypothetical protein
MPIAAYVYARYYEHVATATMGKRPKPITTPLNVIHLILSYDPNEIVFIKELGIEMKGTFRWRIPMDNGKKKAGSLAGCPTSNKNYWRVYILGQEVLAHRLAWYMHEGEDPGPTFLVDHEQGDPFNNNIEYLRLATNTENSRNRKTGINNTSGVTGVYKEGDKFGARIKDERIGLFETFEEATKARKKAAITTYGEFRREEDLAL